MRVLYDGSLLAGIYPGYLESQRNFPGNVFVYRSTNWGKPGHPGANPLRYDLRADLLGAVASPSPPTDTSLLSVLRTTDGLGVGPMYLSRSRDDSKT